MTQQEFGKLIASLRELYFKHCLVSLEAEAAQRATLLRRFVRKLQYLDEVEGSFRAGTTGAALNQVKSLKDAADPENLEGFDAQSDALVKQLELVVPSVSEADFAGATKNSPPLDPVTDEAIGLLQTQTASINNRYEDLTDDGADIDGDAYQALATATSLAASTYRARLSEGDDTINFAELQKYKRKRSDVLSSPGKLFLEDLELLRDYLLELLKVSA
jgi:hypothetical protein